MKQETDWRGTDMDIYFFSIEVICSTLAIANREYVSHKVQLGDKFIYKVPYPLLHSLIIPPPGVILILIPQADR